MKIVSFIFSFFPPVVLLLLFAVIAVIAILLVFKLVKIVLDAIPLL